MHILRAVAVLSLSIAPVACKGSSEPPVAEAVDRVKTRGKVVRVHDDMLDIHHERIEAIRSFDGTVGPMDPMVMQFKRGTANIGGIAVGDFVEIEFTVHYKGGTAMRLVSIAKLPADTQLAL